LLQRALGIGYGRGARLIDFMAEDGIVGAYNGSQAREGLITVEQWEEMSGQKGEAPAAIGRSKRPSNKIRPETEEVKEDEEPPFDAADPAAHDYEDEEEDASEYEDDEDESDESDDDYEEDEDDDYRAHSA